MADKPETSFEDNNIDTSDDMEVVTMVDVLKEEQELEEDATAVLGGSDEKNCTYSKGYLKRQALYACLTCIPAAKTDASKRAGVCLACSYHCHEGHDLIELYTKRNFRCDCGNSKFGENNCSLENDKETTNELNTYNHNFSGLYCTCERPYPDPDDNVIDDMIQCIICEDWYHCRHLGASIPSSNTYSEMICKHCVSKNEFLLNYSSLTVLNVATDDEVPVQVKSEQTDDGASDANQTDCKMPQVRSSLTSAKFFMENWRQQLCTCKSCIDMYTKNNVEFLIDMQDTVHSYEEKGKAKASESSSQYEQGMRALSSLDRVKQVEAISEYNLMKEHLKEYLQKFATNKKVVREEDIREFFSTMAARKKAKVEIPYFCR